MTYCCEFLFSAIKFVKSKHHATPANEHLVELIPTSYKCAVKIFGD